MSTEKTPQEPPKPVSALSFTRHGQSRIIHIQNGAVHIGYIEKVRDKGWALTDLAVGVLLFAPDVKAIFQELESLTQES